MGVPSNTTETYSRVGIREDLADVIYNISPVETPFISNAGKGSATQTNHEWQTDALEAAAANAQKKEMTMLWIPDQQQFACRIIRKYLVNQ